MARRYSDVEVLTAGHAVSDFDCGNESLNHWIRKVARQANSSGTSRVYVVRRLADDVVVGFYGLATGAALPAEVTPRFLKGAGNYPQPVIVLTRLGVDVTEHRRGLGRALLKDAFLRVVEAAELVGVRGLLIHAEDDQARDFYMAIAGFEQSPTDERHLLLLMKDLRKALP